VGFSASVTPGLMLQLQLTEELAQAPSQAVVDKQQQQQQQRKSSYSSGCCG